MHGDHIVNSRLFNPTPLLEQLLGEYLQKYGADSPAKK
jgi:hypothetical protein